MPHEDGRPEYHLQPGESLLVTGPALLRTVLGSCVGIAFWASRLGVAALCHPMLPWTPEGISALARERGRRYVDFAIRELTSEFDRRGLSRAEVTVKLFGGADVLRMLGNSGRATVGRLNGEAAVRVLREEGYDVAASSLGGEVGVDIRFDTVTGAVFVRRLAPACVDAASAIEDVVAADNGMLKSGKVNRWSAC
jgi:chemotaxis receptor (MCP) glutamine deamidase CheD